MTLRFFALSTLALAIIACSDGSRGGGGGDDDDDDGAGGNGGVGVGGEGPGSGGATTCVPSDGEFFMALSVREPYAKTPIVFAATLQFDAGGMHATLQPLASSDRKTAVGSPIEAPPRGPGGFYPVGPAGEFSADLVDVTIPGAANPITGSDFVADVTLTGTICASSGCGTVDGTLEQPIMLDLAGSTFTMERVTGPDDYPEPPKINCAGDLANPLAP